jgi:short subunit dehydrogenase-like uncharacterized protein
MASSPTFLLYGANGYTGELIAEEAVRRGLRPILAGRREEAVRPIAERLGLERRIFALTSPDEIARQLDGVAAVLLAAGPFSATSAPVVEACLRARKHYLDITGEFEVFEAIFRRGPEARERGCLLLPGTGFDVVPSDCLAASLKRALPGAVRLELAFAGESRFSKGTAKTMLEGLPRGGAVREAGRLRRVPLAWRTARIRFRDRERTAMTIPWGDVSTAFHSTGIPDIAVYLALPERAIAKARRMRYVAWIFGLQPVRAFVKRRIERTVKGPDARLREAGRSHFWGRVADAAGRSVEGTLETPEGYQLTVLTAVECARRVLAGEAPSGAVTPSQAFGPDFITTFAGCDLEISPIAAPSTIPESQLRPS